MFFTFPTLLSTFQIFSASSGHGFSSASISRASEGRLIERRLSATMRSYPYILFFRRFLQAEFLKLFGPHFLQTAERGYPVITVQNTQSPGNSYRNQWFFKCCIVQDAMKRAVETPLGDCIGLAARYLVSIRDTMACVDCARFAKLQPVFSSFQVTSRHHGSGLCPRM